jgi:hypothetical protein
LQTAGSTQVGGQTQGGQLRTDVNLNSLLTTNTVTGQRVCELSFVPRSPWASNANLNGSIYSTRFAVGLSPSSGSTAGQKAIQFGVALSDTSFGMTGFVAAEDYDDALNPTTLLTLSLPASSAGASPGTFKAVLIIEQTVLGIQLIPSWSGASSILHLTAAQVAGHLGIATPADLRALALYPHLHLGFKVPASPGSGGAKPQIDDFAVNNVTSAPGTPWGFPPLTYQYASPQPVGATEPVLATLATIQTENDGSALTLTVQPSNVQQISDTFNTNEHAYDAGYFASFATSGRRRRTWRMDWPAITAADFATLLSLSANAGGQAKTFTWTDGETGEAVRCRFAGPLQYKQLAPTVYSASADVVEVLS